MTTLGVDIGGIKMLLVVEYQGEKISKIVPTGKTCTPGEILREIKEFINNLPFTIDAMGVAVPGLVEQNRKVVISDVLPNIAGMDTDFLRINNIPVYMMNDVKAALIQETVSNEKVDTVVIMVGTGIAAGIKQDGHFVEGCKGWAGELGSIPIPTSDGVRKLDELASGASIIAKANSDASTFIRNLEQGDVTAHEVVKSAGGYLGLAIATVINLLNPQRIILGGGTILYEGYFESAVEVAKENTLPELWEVCTIRKSEDAKYMVAQGAVNFVALQENK
ncbi:ROK family protein [Sporosarcina obsidiansis]|uniref:ROK family protein n=1 Tax=Sporosarcina obsidiansis TaxID=2660748 RepID=UPI00129AC8F3|nr:ROK family protein [Sporosarcina obsidiansis]